MEAEQALGSSRATGTDIAKALPLLTRIRLWVFVKLIKFIVPLAFRFRKTLPKNEQPTYLKTYSEALDEPCRVFIPASYKAGDKPLPLFIDIHGGGAHDCFLRRSTNRLIIRGPLGWTLGHALADDRDNALLSQKHGIAVVSIPYRKAPDYPFPAAPKDCAKLIKAILDDPSLPVDKSRVAVGGYSAGGNMSLTAVQLDGLHERIKGLVLFYPATNLAKTLKEKLAVSKIAPGRKNDMLERLGPMFQWAYIPAGTDKRDPLLSPYFAPREKLPKKMFFLGCEYDLLCQEAHDMAEKWAEAESGEKSTAQNGDSWEKGGIKWELLRGCEHGFNQTPPNNEEDAKVKRAKQEAMHESVAKWLFEQVYSDK